MSAAGNGHEGGGFDAGKVILNHVSNSSLDHPIIHIPPIFGIDFSVTKHVLMLWIVAAIVFSLVSFTVRKYLKQDRPIPSGFMNAIEAVVLFIRDSIILPNIGKKFTPVWTPLILTFFFFILSANAIGMIPVFDLLGAINRFILHVDASDSHNFINNILHGGVTATANYNVTAALATITFITIILAGSRAHGFFTHWKNLVPKGLAWPVYIILIPIEIIGMFVKPFALTMRLAANMTGGHIAILAILSFVFIFSGLFHSALAGIGVGVLVSVPLAVAISALEIIVILVQAYVFTMLSAVFIGMAINVHH
ncbi:MAG: F0F1 ATP synthase subunit A [Candidatus Marinimicrobia bacterium]|nr:F0F1 ATP synthase subunit A [Candidatus Neomarinimicrobiota bacterium]